MYEKIYDEKKISLSVGNQIILNSVNLQIFKGEIVFIIGETGAGKTSLLKKVCETISKDIKFSIVEQNFELFNKESVYENIFKSFPFSACKTRYEFNQTLKEYCHYFNILKDINKKISKANGGLKQITAIIRALMVESHLTILDEPTSSLDSKDTVRVMDLIKHLNIETQRSFLWATHDKSLISNLKYRKIILKNGRQISTGVLR